MTATVRLLLADGQEVTLCPGDVIGRMLGAALVLDDARVSEAHALVSLRGAELKLLALRGMFAVDGLPSAEIALAAGQRLGFADGLELQVVAVHLPESLPALAGDGLPPSLLHGSSSLIAGPPPRLLPRHVPDADAWLWLANDVWRLAIAGESARRVEPGDRFVVRGARFELTALRVERASVHATAADGRIADPLRLVVAYDTAQVHRADRPPVLLGGISARLVALVAEAGVALDWDVVARAIWPGDVDRDSLRRRLDVAMARLRSRLRAEGLRTDLLRANGAGQLELVRYPGDEVTVRDG